MRHGSDTPLRRRRVFIAAAFLLLSVPATATILVEVPLEDMVRDSQGVVRATVIDNGVQMQMMPGGGLDPTTITTLRVEEWVVGEGAPVIRIREIGGETQHIGMRIAGTPRYSPGSEVIVVLDRDADGYAEYFRTYGMVQGKFIVLRGAPGVPDVVLRDTEGVGFASWTEGQMTIEHGEHSVLQLEPFLERIREIGALDGRPHSTGAGQ